MAVDPYEKEEKTSGFGGNMELPNVTLEIVIYRDKPRL